MPSVMKRPRLEWAQAQPDSRLALRFIDKRMFILDMRDDIARYPGLAPLKDPRLFSSALLGDAGWTIEWPEADIQIGADTLLLDALAQSAEDEDTRIFMQWRASECLPIKEAANALGVAPRTISRYGSGRIKVPHTLALACLGLKEWQRRATGHA